jgi:hypothetical protein
MGNQQLYDRDFCAWAIEQAELLRARRLSESDIENIAEEIESLGKSEKRELISRLTVLLVHPLKWQYQSVLRGRICSLTLEEQRNEFESHLADNPSLKSTLGNSIAVAYRRAVMVAMRETGMERSVFPTEFPWTPEQIAGPNFFPEATN